MKNLVKKIPLKRLTKFVVVGGSTLAIDFAIYFALTRFIHLPYLLSRSISIIIALVWNFTLNRNWTFKAKAGHLGKQAARFLTVMTITSLLNLGLMRVGVSYLHFNDLLVLLVVAMLITGINFFSHQFWSYKLS